MQRWAAGHLRSAAASIQLDSLFLVIPTEQEMLDDDLRELEASAEAVKSVSASPVGSPKAAAARREGNAEKTL